MLHSIAPGRKSSATTKHSESTEEGGSAKKRDLDLDVRYTPAPTYEYKPVEGKVEEVGTTLEQDS